MGHRVVVLASAEQDLKDLRAYIVKNFSVDTWQSTYAQIKTAVRHLQDYPQAGSIPEEIEKLHLAQYRQLLVGMSRIVYELRQGVVYIHIVADARRDMKTLLTRRLFRSP